MNKTIKIIVPVLIAVVVLAIVATVMTSDNPSVDLNLNQETVSAEEKEIKMDKMYIEINGEKFTVNLEDNSTSSALINLLPLTISMNDLNGNEKYAYLAESLPTNTYSPKHIEAGDVMLFGDNCLVVFYKSFDTEYGYSKIGHIEGLSEMGGGEVLVRFDLVAI